MEKAMNKKLKWKTIYKFAFVCLFVLSMSSVMKVSAEEIDKQHTANIRFIFTTDLHGQLNSTDYETGGKLSVGGLARAYDLISKARNENPNYMTFDLGDVIYDYTTEFYYSKHPNMIQPIYLAMKKIGYDAITLGNHEFDYDYDYVRKQLTDAGLMEKVVLSNLTESKSGKHPFAENKIITKTVTSDEGDEFEIKVGVIGETLPVLSAKGQDFTGVLKVSDIVENVKEQAIKLREQGAQIVVVLSHSGMGEEEPAYMAQNVSYALTKIDAVDVVMCGHEHNEFPTKNQAGAYYKLSGVDKSNNLVNGKNLVMAPDRGEGIGVIDLKIQVYQDALMILERNSEVRKATDKNTSEDSSIAKLYDDFSDIMLGYTKKIIGTVAKDERIENFNGLVEDNSAIQLLNDAKRSYAMNYIHNKATEYMDYPVIAASTYVSYGANGYEDFVNISGELTESDLASMQIYNGYTALYKITGKQLREWLEWSASAYVQSGINVSWSGNDMADYMKSSRVNSLIDKNWLDEWNSFYVFDGVEYTINTEAAPRYNKGGSKINDTTRISSLTCNGNIVKDSDEFVLAVGKLAKTTEANKEVSKQHIYKGYVSTQGIISDYIAQKCKYGPLDVKPDYNWRVQMPLGSQFLVKTSVLGENLLPTKEWFVSKLGTKNDYVYSIGSFKASDNRNRVKLMVSETYSEATTAKVKVAVQATSASAVTDIRYKMGEYEQNSEVWFMADKVEKGAFYVKTNGVYTVWAKDASGNVAVEKIKINNINSSILKKPTVATYTNRKTKIEGTAQPGTQIVIETKEKVYKTFVDSKGKYSFALPAQNSGTTITLYAINEKDGSRSENVSVKVKRTGPNLPTANELTNNADVITGNLNDDDADVCAIIDRNVYVGNEETKTRFLECTELYKDTYEIIVTNVRVDSVGEYRLSIPVQKIGTEVKVYTIDHLSRRSRANTLKVKDVAPNPPMIYEVLTTDNKIEGYVTTSKKTVEATVYVSIRDKNYVVATDPDGYFEVPVEQGVLATGSIVRVYAKDVVKDIQRTSYASNTTVKAPEQFLDEDATIEISYCHAGDTAIQGSCDPSTDYIISIYQNGKFKRYDITSDSDGMLDVELDDTLTGREIIYIYSREINGEIGELIKITPTLDIPKQPVIRHTITNMTTLIQAYVDSQATVVATIDGKKYETSECIFDTVTESYVYDLIIPMTRSGKNVTIYAYNDRGSSSKYTTCVEWLVPENLQANKIYTTTKTIKGTIDGDSYTKVYARIGTKEYEGKVTEAGTFSIKIPTQKLGTRIMLWGENENGIGFISTVKVIEKTTKK